jgi:hypothetical protein
LGLFLLAVIECTFAVLAERRVDEELIKS